VARKYLAILVVTCGCVGTVLRAETNLAIVPIRLRHGDLLAETTVNGSAPLEFKVDTGFGINVINPNRVESLGLKRVGSMTIIGIAGEERADTYGGAVLNLGTMSYAPRRIAALPSESRRRWRTRDGILGAGFFRKFVVEIDIPAKQMKLYQPEAWSYAGKGEIIPIHFQSDTPIIDVQIVPAGKEPIQGRFEIDTGCDDAVCVGHEFVLAHQLLNHAEDANESRRGVGGSADIRPGKLQELRLGNFKITKPSANFFLEGSPAGDGQAGHIGLGALERFRMVFDYSRKRLILEPL
jgi:hypothetical protein